MSLTVVVISLSSVLTDNSKSDRNRFFGLVLRKPRGPPKKQSAVAEKSRRGRGKADEEELLRNLALIEGKGSLEDADDNAIPGIDTDSDDDKVTKIEKPTTFEMPHPRFNAQLAVQGDIVYIYGGTFEKGDREFTFDELHAVDLGKLDGVKEIFRREPEDWQGSDEEDSEDEDDEDDDDGSDDDETEEITPATSVAPSIAAPEQLAEQEEAADVNDEADDPAEALDTTPHPRPFESLREFFTRTSHAWQELILEEMKFKHHTQIAERSVKEIRKSAFSRSEQKWWDCREDIQALEDEQEAAGIGEVVSIETRGGEGGGGAGRRR